MFRKIKAWIRRKQTGIKAVTTNKRGEFYLDKVIGMIIAVVIGGLLLAGLYALFNNTVLPGLTDKIQSMFSYPDTKAIYLHLDSDYAGRRGAAGFITVLGDRYDVRYLPPKYGKDYNDYLMHLIHLENLKTERTQKNELRKEKTEPR